MIVSPPEDLAVAIGENATFICVASGSRPPNVQWFQMSNDSLIFIDSESETTINDTVTSMLLINNVMENDFGEYFCIASNEFSISRANFSLLQLGKLS